MKTSLLFTDKTLPKCRISSKNEINLYDFFNNIMLLLFLQFPLIKAIFAVEKIDDYVTHVLDMFKKNIQDGVTKLSTLTIDGKITVSSKDNYEWFLNINNYKNTYLNIDNIIELIDLSSVYSIYIYNERLEISCLNVNWTEKIDETGSICRSICTYVNSKPVNVILNGNIRRNYINKFSVYKIVSNYRFNQVKDGICMDNIHNINNLMILERNNQRYRVCIVLTVLLLLFFILY